ncbi:MAG TPA: DNA repair and recombination protein RadA [Candidatus Nanoarchaeia archaeon]|nr:DNA repair and recombination protein RadA [Candidatus Nanoarchaeia archaeon]
MAKEKGKEVTLEDLPGVGAATAEKLKEAGYDSLLSIAVASAAEMVEITGLNDIAARKLIKAARDELKMGFESGVDLLKKRENLIRISTGSKALDGLFAGGVESSGITECYGQYGVGKSALAHQLAVNVQLPRDKGGAEGIAVWIDSEATFRPERVKQIAEAQGMDSQQVLENIKVARAFNSDHQILLAEKVTDLIKEGMQVKLVVVDSLMGHLRSDFIGRGQLADRQQKLNKHIHSLLRLATTYNVVVYVTNQVMTKPDTFFGDPTEPIGGNVLAHGMTTRVYLRKGKKGTRVAKMVDSPFIPENECVFIISDKGIRDVE